MARTILFEGKVTLANQLVDFRIYKNQDVNIKDHYSFEVNPEVKDVSQVSFYNGGIQLAGDLESLLFQFKQFQKLFTQIDAMRFNTNF